MSTNHYPEAIDILQALKTPAQFKKIVVELAKQDPENFILLSKGQALVKAQATVAAVAQPAPEPVYFNDVDALNVVAHLHAGDKVSAIKTLRQATMKTGFTIGLKEAKDIVDAVYYGDSLVAGYPAILKNIHALIKERY